MIPVIVPRLKRLLAIAIVGYGLWLIYWSTVEASTIYFNSWFTDWRPELIVGGLPSVGIGIIIVLIGAFVWHVKAFK